MEESISSRYVEVGDAEIVDEIIMEDESPTENYPRDYSFNSNGRNIEQEDIKASQEINKPEPPKEDTLPVQIEEDNYSDDDFEVLIHMMYMFFYEFTHYVFPIF